MSKRAQDLVPEAYESSSDGSEGSGDERAEDIVDNLTYDVRNLTACNFSGLLVPADPEERETFLVDQATRAAQLLMKRVFALPVEHTTVDVLAVLPDHEVLVLPRHQRIPDAPVETKWEKFAREKGIQNKKRERMVYDEDDDQWKPRYGYKRGNNGIMDVPVLEIKPGDDPYADPWEAAAKDKKVRVAKNTKQQIKNQERTAMIRGKKDKASARPSSMGDGGMSKKNKPGIPIGLNENGDTRRGKQGVSEALQLAQFSTASMGRYDEYRKEEPKPKLKGKKRAFADNLGTTGTDDNSRMKSNIRIVEDKIDKKARGVTNSLKAYEGIIPDAPADTFKQKKGKGKGATTKAKKPPTKGRK